MGEGSQNETRQIAGPESVPVYLEFSITVLLINPAIFIFHLPI